MTDPLHICLSEKSPVSSKKIINRSGGRPATKDIIKFGPQPASIIIAQILHEKKSLPNVVVDNNNDLNINDQSESPAKVDTYEEVFSSSLYTNRTTSPELHMKHLRNEKEYSCNYPDCGYSCKLSSNLIKHKRVHTNDKPYLCEKCCFRSNFVNSLKAHKRIHTAERPYQCQYCSYKCNSSSNLKKHNKHRHTNSTTCVKGLC